MFVHSESKIPSWFWIVATVLLLWEIMGCYACVEQIKLGAAAMGPVDDWSFRYYDALPFWYNSVYAIATFGALLGGFLLLLRHRAAAKLFWASFVAIIVMFGYAFGATDLVGHKGWAQVLPFPLLIAGVGGFSIWFAGLSAEKGWMRH